MTWKPIRCVVFDWGGVILKHHRCWADACAAAGIEARDIQTSGFSVQPRYLYGQRNDGTQEPPRGSRG